MLHPLHYVLFYYDDTQIPGHAWDGNYRKILNIFMKTVENVGLVPVHIHPIDVEPVCKDHFEMTGHKSLLIHDRHHGYAQAAAQFIENMYAVIICDIDQVFVHAPPALDAHARFVYRVGDNAHFNGVRFITKRSLPILHWECDLINTMSDRFQQWDGDSIAIVYAVYRFLATYKGGIEFVTDIEYNSRPALGANPERSIMYHFKGKAGKAEMLQWAQNEGIIV